MLFLLVPTGVSPPTVDSIRSRDVTLSWQIPTQPNGIITSYSLIALSPIQSTVYTGDSNTLNSTVFSLSPYTEYQVILRVCTVIGCTDSSPVSFLTSEDIPEGKLYCVIIIVLLLLYETFNAVEAT